ncbi:bifunctional protein GlmU-like [Dreissena polymorpha]|uniref:PPC domain-containing protein n=1 Tax=Dreissena polymorpha TaxID=45954 RepID=A0A9D4KTZ9_DREPO|nr:bifunctional protein GlmU-like [Dreissena polymorpha]XP_052272524.1 bifunctional protein GlmU-like [Dreissena polymorpha]KAH3845202.1 hypothetical protein DPMN_087477 [Dreissena polymorpha]
MLSDAVVSHPCLGSTMVTYALRLKPGEEIVSTLHRFVEDNNLGAVSILTCVGSVSRVTLRMADSTTIKTYKENCEIVSLVGTVSAGGHMHACFSDARGDVFGGHVIGDMYVYTTAEILLGECTGLSFTREHCHLSGYDELVVKKK